MAKKYALTDDYKDREYNHVSVIHESLKHRRYSKKIVILDTVVGFFFALVSSKIHKLCDINDYYS